MRLIDGAVARPHTVIVVVLLSVMFGYLALTSIPVQLKPSLDEPRIQIETGYRGASPFEVEEQITRRIEEQMDGVEGIRRVTSVSQDGFSQVTLEFDWGVDKNVAMIDVINKLNQVENFPDEADEPAVNSVTSESTEPAMWIVSLSRTRSPNEMFDLIEDVIEPRLRRVYGVGNVWVFGGEEREMQVRVDPDALVARRISIGEFVGALRQENMNVRGGYFDEGKRQYTVRTVGQLDTIDEVLGVIVKRSPEGPVYLHEVATVTMGFKRRLSQVNSNGVPTVVMGILRKSGANVVQLSEEVKAEIAEINEEFAHKGGDFQLQLVYTDQTYIEESVDLAWENLGYGALLACVVLLLFLRSVRSLLVVGITIPICIITVFIFMKAFGRTLNIISLAGLAFSSGMIVDNAIVVIENIYRHLEMGKRGLAAARTAAQEVWGAILISTLTTLAVFVPVIFIQEEAGQLFKDIAIAICLAIALSLLAALSLLPMMAARLCHAPPTKEERRQSRLRHFHWLYDLLTLSFLGGAAKWLYVHIIHWIVGRSPLRILAKLGVIVLVVVVFWLSIKHLPPAEYLPSGNRNLILVFAQPLVGNNLEKSLVSAHPLEQMLVADERVEDIFAVFGQRFNAVGIIVKPEHASEAQMQAFIGELFGRTRGLPGFESLFPVQMSIFRDPGKQVEIDLIGPDLAHLQAMAKEMEGRMYGLKRPDERPVVQFIRSSFHGGNPEVQVRLDRERCALAGLRVQDVADIVEGLVAGKVVGLYNDQGNQIDLTLYGKQGLIDSRFDLSAVTVHTPGGPVRLDTVVDVITTTGPTAINHVEKERAITLTVNLLPDVALEDALTMLNEQVLGPMRAAQPPAYSIRLAGTADKLNTTLAALTDSFLLALLIIYLLMVALFRSWVYPFIIMVTIPMAMTGAFAGITIAHHLRGGLVGFDVIAMLGLIILSGVVVNNAILIVHQALNFRDEGMNMDEALKASCDSRLRPICMSIFTSVLAMLPLALGQGAGTELYRGLGAVMIGGLLVSTFFTLFLVPSLFSLVQDCQIGYRRLRGKSATEAGEG